MTDTKPPAGWYPDPTGAVAGQKRWWNGESWTADVQAPPPPQQFVPAAVPSPGPVTTPQTTGYGGYTSYTSYTSGAATPKLAVNAGPRGTITPSGLVLALSPIPQAIVLGLARIFDSQVVTVAALGFTIILTVWLAFADRVGLFKLGYSKPASWLWILLGPFIYLLWRFVSTWRENRKGQALLWVQVGTNAAIGALILISALAGFAILQALSGSQSAPTLTDVETVLTEDIQEAADTIVFVDCEDDAVIEEGSEFNCAVTNADGQRGITFVTMVPNGFGGLLPQYTEVDYPQ